MFRLGLGKVHDLTTGAAAAGEVVRHGIKLISQNQVNPLVEKLAAGLLIFSQSYRDDFWLVYKNKHIFVSCFLVHGEHYYTGSERFSVLLVSLCVAFALSTVFARITKGMECGDTKYSNWNDCMQDPKVAAPIQDTIIFSILSSLIQMFYDQSAQYLVTCECAQNWPVIFKYCAEALGKCVFWVLAVSAVIFLAVGGTMIATMGGDFVTSLVMFVCTKLANFMLFTSIVLLVTFTKGRKAQMKPPASVLETEEGKKKWTEPREPIVPCLKQKGPRNELWNKYIGEKKTFKDLPLRPPDYDVEVRISLCCVCCNDCDRVVYASKAKNPMVTSDEESPAPPPAQLLPDQLKIDPLPTEGGGQGTNTTAWVPLAGAGAATAAAVVAAAATAATAMGGGGSNSQVKVEEGPQAAAASLPNTPPQPKNESAQEAGAIAGTEVAADIASAAAKEAAALAARGLRFGADLLGGAGTKKP